MAQSCTHFHVSAHTHTHARTCTHAMYMYVHNDLYLIHSLSVAGFECRQYTHYNPTTHLFDCEGALKDLSVSGGKCDHTRCISVCMSLIVEHGPI